MQRPSCLIASLLGAALLATAPALGEEVSMAAAVACPCAEDFAKAVEVFDARPGRPERGQWNFCSLPRGRRGLLVEPRTTKFDALTPSDEGRTTTIVLLAARGRNLLGQRRMHCGALVFNDSRFNAVYLFQALREKISEPELVACEKLALAIAKCPDA